MIDVHSEAPAKLQTCAPATGPKTLNFAAGLAPFGEARHFSLLMVKDAPPFARMECKDVDVAFTLIDPFLVAEEYRPEVSDADLQELGLKAGENPMVMVIVNLSNGPDNATINLAAPLLINTKTGGAKQAILVNAAQYNIRHRLIPN